MLIANPIYDVVFKYLMDDNKVARLIISCIIEEEIEELEFRPTEKTVNMFKEQYTVYRLDFTAKIKTPDGYKLVLIELQKAKFYTDIMRFRKYLGNQYSSDENVVREPQSDYAKALPIITIYFLGHKLEHLKSSVIKVKRKYYDGVTKEELKEKEEFIESLTHDSFIIQIPYLKEKRRNELEILLSVFDQTNITNDYHILNIREDDIPEKYRSVIRRLNKAVADEKVKNSMEYEDFIVEEFCIRERINSKAIEEKDKALKEKDDEIERLKKRLDDLNKR